MKPIQDVDEFKEIYEDARIAMNDNNRLEKRHIAAMVNTILRRR